MNQIELQLAHAVRYMNPTGSVKTARVEISEESVARISQNTKRIVNAHLRLEGLPNLPEINLRFQQLPLAQRITDFNNRAERLKEIKDKFFKFVLVAGTVIALASGFFFATAGSPYILGLLGCVLLQVLFASFDSYVTRTLQQDLSNIKNLASQFNQQNSAELHRSVQFYRGKNFAPMMELLESQLDSDPAYVEELLEDIAKLYRVARFYQNLGMAEANLLICVMPDLPRDDDGFEEEGAIPAVESSPLIDDLNPPKPILAINVRPAEEIF